MPWVVVAANENVTVVAKVIATKYFPIKNVLVRSTFRQVAKMLRNYVFDPSKDNFQFRPLDHVSLMQTHGMAHIEFPT